MRSEKGFTLVAAIFLLVVVAGLVAYFVNLRVVQSVTLVYGTRGALAMEAARSGIEWAAFVSLRDSACPLPADSSFTPSDAELDDFTITVSCSQSSHQEGGTVINVFRIESTASAGSYGTLDYVQRSISASVSFSPP